MWTTSTIFAIFLFFFGLLFFNSAGLHNRTKYFTLSRPQNLRINVSDLQKTDFEALEWWNVWSCNYASPQLFSYQLNLSATRGGKLTVNVSNYTYRWIHSLVRKYFIISIWHLENIYCWTAFIIGHVTKEHRAFLKSMASTYPENVAEYR